MRVGLSYSVTRLLNTTTTTTNTTTDVDYSDFLRMFLYLMILLVNQCNAPARFHLYEQLMSDIVYYLLYIAAQRRDVLLMCDGSVLTGRRKCIWKIYIVVLCYMLLCDMACDTGDYRFPMSNLFRKQMTSGFEETHNIGTYIIIKTGHYMKLRLGEKKRTDRQYKKIQKKKA